MHKSILVVDDVEDWREQLKSTLKRSGYVVDTAENYDQALTKLQRSPAELVIVDVRLDPADEDNTDGIKLLEALHTLRINALVLTGYGTQLLKEKAQALEAITFLEKGTIGRSSQKLRSIINKIFSEMETRDKYRKQAAQKFSRGEVADFPTQAAGYPLRASLNKDIDKVVNGS